MMPYKNVFLIDDDDDDQDLFCSAVGELSKAIVCTPFSNGLLALAALKNMIPDVIFLDWNMPVMNGEEFLTAIKKDRDLTHIPVIVISTTAHPETMFQSQQLGARAFITKPNKYSDLILLLKPFICMDQTLSKTITDSGATYNRLP